MFDLSTSQRLTFSGLDAAQAYVLGTDGNLWFTPAPFGAVPDPNRRQVDGNVAAFQGLDAAQAYVLGTDGNLWLESAQNGHWGQVPPPRVQVDGNVAAFQGLNPAQAYVLGTDGNLWFTPAPFGAVPDPNRRQVDGNVAF